jgi:hypothetical protein
MGENAGMEREPSERSADLSRRGPHAVPFLTRRRRRDGTDYPSLAAGPAVRGYDGSDPAVANRVRKARVRLAREESRLANEGYSVTVADTRADKAREDLSLAEQGLKRQFLTGRIVPVKASRRARAHPRRL